MTTLIEAVRVGQSETAALIPDPEAQPVMAIKEVQRIFPVSRSTLYEAIRQGDIPAIRVGNRWLIPTAAVRRLLLLDPGAADDG